MRKFYFPGWQPLLATLLLVLSAGASNAQQYCTSSLYSTGCTNNDYIQAVTTTGGSTNISNTQSVGCSNTSSAYTYFSTQSVTSSVGSTTCSLSVTIGPFSETVYVFIDWNSDGDFVDPNESVLSGMLSAGVTGAGVLTIPAGTTNGTKRMRVRCVYGGSTAVTACSFESEGEVEDYNFVVTGGVNPCSAPANLTASNITSAGATFNWQTVPGALNYEYVVDNSLLNPTSGFQSASAPPITVSNLGPATPYYFHLRAVCGANVYSSWVAVPFTTAATSCFAPASVSISNTNVSATLTWPSAAGGATSYEHANTTSVTPPTSGSSTTALTASYNGLTPNTTYYAHVRSNCNGSFSTWQTQAYTTAATGIADAAHGGVGLYATPNPANNWITVRAEGVSAGSAALLTITDIAGRVLHSINITGKEKEISIADIPAGLYLLRYTSADRTGVVRFQKL